MCELLAAVRDGKSKKTVELLGLDYFYNLPSWNQGQGIVLLREALARGHCDIAKLLLSKGARVNNKLGNPTNDPLHFAVCLPRSIDIVELLLAEGAKINSTNGDGCTPLHLAVFTNNEPAVKILLENHALPDAEDLFRNTPLHVAAERSFSHMVELLLAHGAKPDMPLVNGFTPLHLACLHAKNDIVTVLTAHGADVNAPSEEGTPLDLALPDDDINPIDKRISVVTTLLEAGAKANSLNNRGKPILHRAVEKSISSLVAVIVKYSNVNALAMDVSHKSLLSPIQLVASKGDLDIADMLIAHGADVNMPCNSEIGGNCTPLHIAACYGHINIVEKLLKRGADVEVKTLEGKTPLFTAISNFQGTSEDDCLKIVTLLINSGAKFNTVDLESATILHAAAEKQSLSLIKLIFQLIQKANFDVRAFVNSLTIAGFSPLHIAASHGCIDIAQYLLENGAQINLVSNAPTSEGYTALHLASKYTRVDIIKLFLQKGADVNYLSCLNQTPAHVVLSTPDSFSHKNLQNAVAAVSVLLESGTNLNCVDKNGDTVLNLGVRLRCLPVVEEILKFKPDTADVNNRIALRTAVLTGTKFSDDVFSDFSFNLRCGAVRENRSIIETLQNHGLVFSEVDVMNADLLHHAIRKGYTNVVEYLLERGADHMALGSLGTPLHSAVFTLQAEIVKILVYMGANVNAVNQDGKTPISLVTEKLEGLKVFRDFGDTQRCFNIAKELLSNGADLSNDPKFLIIAVQKKSRELVSIALKSKADVKVIGQNGFTVLHAAVYAGDDELVKILVEHGAVVDAKDEAEQTPLLIAVSQKEELIVERLLGCGADVNVTDQRGNTPLHFAATWGRVAVIEKLLERGAQVDAKNAKKFTPMLQAAEVGRGNAIKALLRGGADPLVKLLDNATTLHRATKWADASAVETLLYYGADIKARTVSHLTPLGCSLQACHPHVVRILLENGGYTPDMCCSMGQALQWYTKSNLDGSIELKEVFDIFFLEIEARQLWPDRPQCYCRTTSLRDFIRGHDSTLEIERLRTTPLVKNLHFYDLISKTKSQLVTLTRNESFVLAMNQINLPDKFPIFGKLLKYKWEAAVTREKLLSSGLAAFNSLVVESIISSINNQPLDSFTKSTYCWVFQFLKISDLDRSDFVQYLRRIDSLLPAAVVEKIVRHLSDTELKHLAAAAPTVTVSP